MNRRQFCRRRGAWRCCRACQSTGVCTAGPERRRAGAATGNEPFELHEATIDDLQEAMRSGRLTARAITELYLARIEALNRQGPELRAIIETNPEALAIADRLDAERKAGKVRGPLHGIPVALKDNIDTHDRMTTTAGSLALEGSVPPQDSFVASKLREAGAILLAKANMSEWAYWRGLHASSGWSARGGQCRNPYALDRNPCGSSSGSGVAASANLAALTIGTETGGSIMCPSSINGIVGHQADGRPVEPLRHHPDLALAGLGGTDDPNGPRRRDSARRRRVVWTRAILRHPQAPAAFTPTTRPSSIPPGSRAHGSASSGTSRFRRAGRWALRSGRRRPEVPPARSSSIPRTCRTWIRAACSRSCRRSF